MAHVLEVDRGDLANLEKLLVAADDDTVRQLREKLIVVELLVGHGDREGVVQAIAQCDRLLSRPAFWHRHRN
ncbi:hypothetical protein P12x_006200 (plasmid) [Tundrisphaera lichenicola]|uniref:hypothetical protein n=1 Tax=Tundrisphaera lichenicola TaxID=2029860 RepID=UPI003EBA11DE